MTSPLQGDLDPVYVSVSNLDAVDFVAIAIVSHHTRWPCRAFVDTSTVIPHPGTEHLDPRGAVPLPMFDRGPDGLVKQVVHPLLGGGRVLPRQTGHVRADQDVPAAVERMREGLVDHSPVSFVQEAFDRLAPGIDVRQRQTRTIKGPRLRALLEIIEAQVSRIAGVTPGDVRSFTQGGYLNDLIGNAHLDRWSLGPSGEVSLHGEAGPRALDDLALTSEVEARGPLDAATWCTTQPMVCAHLPWFLDATLSVPGQEPTALEIVQSLFLRNRDSDPNRDVSCSGVLLDEYADAGVDHYQQLVGAEQWVYDAVRWMATNHCRSRERWAWSQSAARKLTEELRRNRIPEPPAGLLRESVLLARRVDASVAAAFADDGAAGPTQERVSATAGDVEAVSRRWSRHHQRWGLPADFGSESDVSLDNMPERIQTLLRGAPNRSKALAGLRSLAWRVAENGVRTLMIVGDTQLRASLPTLSLFADGPAIAEFVQRNQEVIADRVSAPRAMVIV